MPNWKKLIVSGSDATLNTLNVSTDITASGDIKANAYYGDGSALTGLPAGYTDSDVTDHIDSLAVVSGSATQVRTFLNVENGADVTDTTNVVAALSSGTNVNIAADGTISSTDTNTQLSTEAVQDIVGGMVSGNTESGITVTYQDDDGTIDFSVASQTDQNFTTDLKNKLDGIEASADVTDTTNVKSNLPSGVVSGSQSEARTQLGLGTAATAASTDFVSATSADTVAGVLTFSSEPVFNAGISLPDSTTVKLGAGDDLRLTHNGTNSYIQNYVGGLEIINYADDKDISFQSDNGSGGVTEYFRVDGSSATVVYSKHIQHGDNVYNYFGSGNDLQIYHNGSHSFIRQLGNGELYIDQLNDNRNTIFRSDDGSGGLTEYFRINGDTVRTEFEKDLRLSDNVNLQLGSSGDMRMFHNGTNTFFDNYTGHLYIRNNVDDDDGGNIYIQAKSGENGIVVQDDSAVLLYYNDALKLATTSTGVDITGDLDVSGTITSNKIVSNIVSQSILLTSGSNTFGDHSSDVHNFTGSVSILGDLDITGTLEVLGSDTDPIFESKNTSAGSSKQFFLEHDYGDVRLGNARGNLHLDNNGSYIISQSNSVATISGNSSGNYTLNNTTGEWQFRANGSSVNSMTINSSGVTINEDVTIPNKIIHSGDTNTYLQFQDDVVDIYAGGTRFLTAFESTQDVLIVNEGGTDVDFRVESSNNANMLFVDGENDTVGIGISDPDQALEVNGNIKAAGGTWIRAQYDSTHYAQLEYNSSGGVLRGTGGGGFLVTSYGDSYFNGGDVGIGTSSPGFTLDVNGSLHATNFTIADAIYHEGDTNNYIQFGTDTQSFVTNGTSRITIDSSGNTTFGGATYFSEYLYHSGDTNTYLRFQTDDIRMFTGGTERIRLNGSGIAFNNQTLSSVNDLQFADPGPNEGLSWSGGNFKIYESPDDLTTNTKGNLQIVSGSTRVATFGAEGETALYVEGSGSTVFEVQGSEGQLFSITDDLTGDLFSVSDISGIPLFNVNASDESYFTGQLEVQGLLTGSTADFSTSITLDTHVMSDSTDRTGLVLLDNNRASTVWSGHQYTNDSGQLWSIMGNNADFGLYDDSNSEWALLYNINAGVELYHNGSKKVETTSGGIAVAGAITATGDITAYYSSDRRLKENIKPIENATEKIKKIGGYKFDWKPNDNPEMIHEGHDIGVIAQEVEAVLPEVVQDRDNGYKAVEYQKLVALLIESNKELAARVEELEKKLQ